VVKHEKNEKKIFGGRLISVQTLSNLNCQSCHLGTVLDSDNEAESKEKAYRHLLLAAYTHATLGNIWLNM